MLLELRVENLLLIERAELRLAAGLNVLTGETGAGKTVLAHALDLLLGGRARNGIVRPGAAEAYVEGSFELTDELRERLGERLSEDVEEVVLARCVSAEGRTRAYINGRSASAGDLCERLRHLEALRGAALAGAEALAPEADGAGVAALLGEAERSLDAVGGVDGALDALAERARALRLESDDLATELRRYEEGVEA